MHIRLNLIYNFTFFKINHTTDKITINQKNIFPYHYLVVSQNVSYGSKIDKNGENLIKESKTYKKKIQ